MKYTIAEAMKKTDNPGSGIIVGKSSDGKSLLTACFICCSSADSLHRRFIEDGGGVSIQPTAENNSAYIYQPVLTFENKVLMGNSAHIERVYTALSEGKSFSDAAKADGYTSDMKVPRITALVDIHGGDFDVDMRLSKPISEDGGVIRENFHLSDIRPGTAFMLTMYTGEYGYARPFEGDPVLLQYDGSIFDVVADIWENMNGLSRVSLWVRETDMISHRAVSRIINRNK